MHPLPRVGELDAAFDTDRRAVYFEQAAYGVPVRMALISLLLGLQGKSLHRFEGGFETRALSGLRPAAQPGPATASTRIASCTIRWKRNTCATSSIVREVRAPRRGCAVSIASARSSTSSSPARSTNGTRPTPRRCTRSSEHGLKDFVLFADEADAQAAGFHSRRAAAEGKPAASAPARQDVARAARRHDRRHRLGRSLARLPPSRSCSAISRLDPVRGRPDAARRHAGHPLASAPAISARPMCCAPATRRWPRRPSSATCSRAPSPCWCRCVSSAATWRSRPRLGAFLGHLFPVWLKFKGGKGVATYIGVLLGLAWPAALAFCVIWLAVAALTRYSSLAALIASAATPAVLLGHACGPGGGAVRLLTVHAVDHAPRQHRAAARRAPKARSVRRRRQLRAPRTAVSRAAPGRLRASCSPAVAMPIWSATSASSPNAR